MRTGILNVAVALRERRTTQEAVHEFLREAILSGRLRGGTRLVQEEIATELEVSRVPVREALLQLASEGIVRMEAHRGATVAWLSPAEVAEIFEIRGLLVSKAVRLSVPQLTEDQLRRLEDIDHKHERRASMAVRRRLNHQFYATLFENLDRPRLHALMDKLESEVERYLQPLERPHMGHTELISACRRRDAERAAEIVGQHLDAVARRVVARLEDLVASGELPHPGGTARRGRPSRASGQPAVVAGKRTPARSERSA
ncbi:MAG: GntR family transcriptional regulator [Chloroflexota bacterium]